MTSRGIIETEKLRQNLQGQLDRLVQQLEDLESCKDDLEESEYTETKNDTIEQLKEFNESLSRMISGDMTLVDHFSAMQLATQAAISAAFRTPAVIRMFARREPELLRERLANIERDLKLGKGSTALDNEKVEILSALKQLGEKLSDGELSLINNHSSTNTVQNARFLPVSDYQVTGQEALTMAGNEARVIQGSQ